ncbi:MAG: hypothetical protein AB8F65_00075 [Woeseiaceae bacterium]
MPDLHKKTLIALLIASVLIAGILLYKAGVPGSEDESLDMSPRAQAERRLKLLNDTTDALAIDGIVLPDSDPVGTVTEQFDEGLLEFNQQFEKAPIVEAQIEPPIEEDIDP